MSSSSPGKKSLNEIHDHVFRRLKVPQELHTSTLAELLKISSESASVRSGHGKASFTFDLK